MSKMIHVGRYYERADGVVAKAETSSSCGRCDVRVGDGFYKSSSWEHGFYKERNIIREVQVVPKLDFDLIAGQRYNTVKPDGSAGPVVETYERTIHDFYSDYLKIGVRDECAVLPCGLIICKFGTASPHGYRITSPYSEPPPTLSERILSLRDRVLSCGPKELHDEFEAVAGAVKALEGK